MSHERTNGRSHGREPDRRVERTDGDLLVFTSETEDYNIVDVYYDTEDRHPVAFQTWDEAWAAMHAFAELFGFEVVPESDRRNTEDYQIECPECGDSCPFYVYGFDQSGYPRWYVCSSCEGHFRRKVFRSLYTESLQSDRKSEEYQ